MRALRTNAAKRSLGPALVSCGLALTAAAVDTTQLDLANGLNWDGYISSPEITEANSYDPPSNWTDPTTLGSRMVKDVFGQHAFAQWNYGNRVFTWQSQAPAANVGLPDDGVIAAGSWSYQLVTALDAEPEEGWGNPEYAAPTRPTGLLPLRSNVVCLRRAHSETDPATAKTQFLLPEEQQDFRGSLNLLMFGNAGANRLFRVYARYADDVDSPVLLWEGSVPTPGQALDEATYPSHADLEVAFLATRVWYNVSSPPYNSQRTEDARLFHFRNGLTLDSKRILAGLMLHIAPKQYAAADFVVLAASAAPPPPPPGTLLLIE